jgi:hypothetical protein
LIASGSAVYRIIGRDRFGATDASSQFAVNPFNP